MNKLILVSIFTALLAGAASAVPTVTVNRDEGAVWNAMIGGGEYTIHPNADLMDITGLTGAFKSFCLEASEPIQDDGTVTYFARVSTEAILGNGNDGPVGPEGGDLLGFETAYLYTAFSNGTLAGYNNDSASAGDLQLAIWYLEDELEGKVSYSGLTPRAQDFVDAAIAAGWSDIGKVRVLNLWTEPIPGKLELAQDMLVVVVPAPGALLAASIGLTVVGWLRMRRSL